MSDVKTEVQPSTEQKTSSEGEADVKSKSRVDEELEFGELEDSKERNIPYGRFKEVNGKYRDTLKELKEYKENFDAKVQAEIEAREIEMKKANEFSLFSPSKKDEFDDPYDYLKEDNKPDPKISLLESQLNRIADENRKLKQEFERQSQDTQKRLINNELDKLGEIYPAMEREHVLAVSRVNKDWTLEECAEYSHKRFEARAHKYYEDMVQKKKDAAKSRVMGQGRTPMKAEDRPKNWDDARKKLSQFYSE